MKIVNGFIESYEISVDSCGNSFFDLTVNYGGGICQGIGHICIEKDVENKRLNTGYLSTIIYKLIKLTNSETLSEIKKKPIRVVIEDGLITELRKFANYFDDGREYSDCLNMKELFKEKARWS